MGSLRAVVLASLLVPGIALAEPAKDKKKASELVKQAIAKSQAGDHDAAIELYESAYKIIPQPLLLSNIGSEYQALKKPVEAIRYFCRYIEADPTGSNVTFATAQAKTLYIGLGGVDTVTDADVCKPIVWAGQPAREREREHEQESEPSADEPTAQAESPPSPPAQPHESPKASSLRWVGVGVGVLGAAAFGTGVFFGLKARDISDQITNHDPNTPWPGNINQLEADGASYEKKQIIFMAAGGAAIVAGTVMYFLGGPKADHESGSSVAITPVATPGSVGFAAAGRF